MPEPKVRFKRDDGSSYPVWNEVVLGDIATRVTRKNSKNETDRPLTIASIEGLVDQRTYFGKTIASKDMSGYLLLKNGEYAYNKSYSDGYDYGSIKRLDKYDMGALSTLYICFALNKDQNTDFYDCYFNGLSWYSQMPQICAEGARNHGLLNVSPNDFFKIQLFVPSCKEEQQKIADFLSSVDEVITASEEEVVNLETQKKAVMKKIFSQEVRFKRADGSDFSEWIIKPISELFVKINRRNKDGSCDYVLTNSAEYGIISQRDFFEKDIAVKENTNNYYVISHGDFVYNPRRSKTAPHGPFQRYNGYEDGILSPLYTCFSMKTDDDPKYLVYYFKSDLWYPYILENASQGARHDRESMTDSVLMGIPVSVPCLEEQRLIADFLSDFDEAIAAAKKELELWKELKKGLLQQMFV